MFAIGDKDWPGLSKVVEECGEATQVIGKLMGTRGSPEHWDGAGDLRLRLQEELADLAAAIDFVIVANRLDVDTMAARRATKFALFVKWQDGER